jgi:YVTN family beta-propeller protein
VVPEADATIEVGDSPTRPIRAGDSIWVANTGSATVSQVNPATGEIVATIEVGSRPLTPVAAGDSIWVPNSADGTITRIDSLTGAVRDTVTVGDSPLPPADDGRGGLWVVTNTDSGTLSRINIE